MTIQVRQLLMGSSIANSTGGLSIDGAEAFGRLVAAVQELQQATYKSGEGPILTSPNGSQWRLGVDDAGSLTASPA